MQGLNKYKINRIVYQQCCLNTSVFKNYKEKFLILVVSSFVLTLHGSDQQSMSAFTSFDIFAFAQDDQLQSNNNEIRNLNSDSMKQNRYLWIFIVSFLIIIFTVYVFRRLSRQKSLRSIILDEHGFPTLSKFQFLLWTLVVSFAFLSIQITRIVITDYTADSEYLIKNIPENLLAMMGISVAVPIINSKASKKTTSKQDDKTPPSFGAMFYNNQGNLDLASLQMFMWTVIGILIYLYIVFDQFTILDARYLFLPDVSPTLLILMGLSQGAYLGSKFVGNESGHVQDK